MHGNQLRRGAKVPPGSPGGIGSCGVKVILKFVITISGAAMIPKSGQKGTPSVSVSRMFFALR
ncbi:hypothetical protein AWR36_002985 [Microbulbifer flavimaris]|uniref:Uncharacterized protein n=1 Tax=Microbulbifer flavimaris TaxID=1781068 RepID=A0ABX4I2T1_9GAMM|nr:hypothetical protein AVO43_02990 [Microbulbifer sp. ZGT114]PCO06725.1 hypothetical protein AWR36_002985 [Microbulbifer flavimaris]